MAENSSSESLNGVRYVRAYSAMFAAHWFGSRRFDKVGHESFNPEDMKAYRSQKTAYLKKNFTRSKSVLLRSGSNLQSSPSQTQIKAEVVSERSEQPVRVATESAEGEDVAPEDEVQVVTSKQSFPKFVVFQSTVCCLLFLVFTLQKLIAGDSFEGPEGWLAGLDSFARGTTDLQWASPACEDYRHEIWRWLTYQWTHVGLGDLFANTAMLILLGISLEGYEGTFRVTLIFNLGVLAGALIYFVFEGHASVVGGAGGVYALLGVHFSDLVLNWKIRHFRKLTVAVLLFFLFLDAITFTVTEDVTKADLLYSISLGGLIVGFISGFELGKILPGANTRDKASAALLGVLGVTLAILCLIWLGLNDSPRNIFEAAAGESGYCWVKQFFDPAVNSSSYQCIRCGTQLCISEWRQQDNLIDVNRKVCASQGWYYDGR